MLFFFRNVKLDNQVQSLIRNATSIGYIFNKNSDLWSGGVFFTFLFSNSIIISNKDTLI